MYRILFLVLLVLVLGPQTLSAQRGGTRGPRIAPEDLKPELGVAEIKDHAMFQELSYQGPEVSRDAYLADLEFVKFVIENFQADNTNVYFMNTEKYRAHPPWMGMVGISSRCRGAITYLPRLTNPSGTAGLYIIDFQPNDSFTYEQIKEIFDLLIAKMPSLKGQVAFHPLDGNLAQCERDKQKYVDGGVAVHHDADLYGNISYLPLNPATSYGLLRVMEHDAHPSPRDIVIYKTLPNQMPRVAGVITESRQTPLSHVNLRAVQDKIPNAFINNALQDETIKSLVGKLVRFDVSPQGYKIEEADTADVDAHFANLRPASSQTPLRNLSVKKITPLSEIRFENADVFGVKTSNLATLATFNETKETIPDGFGIPFYFYDEFMKHNELYAVVDQLLSNSEVLADRAKLEDSLKKLRAQIEASEMPDWMLAELETVQKSFAEGTPIRCRSSTNTEDLPGFSGAGLYDSYTHHPDEGHLAKSIKQVFASLWNSRAFEERAFYRIDHKITAMGVLIHANFDDEKTNGVAVTDDILYETKGNYYVNAQLGEDLVTNPDADSSPEETLLGWWDNDGYEIVRRSTSVGEKAQLLTTSQFAELRKHLGRIHSKFAKLYGKGESDKFAMEIEFKITNDGKLVIKQARPWVY